MDINIAIDNFENFLKSYEGYKTEDMSESDTRSKIIDKILIDILGWNENNIKREGHVDSGYYDYKISLANFTFVIEAKRQFVDFELPTPNKNNLIKTSILLEKNSEVINQIRSYLSDVGVSFGVITNGKQFIIGRFYNDNGKSWKENYALIFNGFEDLRKHFSTFYDNLSFEHLVKRASFKFYTQIQNNFSRKIISTLIDRDKEIDRNSLSINLSAEIDHVFGEIYNSIGEDDEEFIKACFVENTETIKNKLELNGLFGDLPPDWDRVIKAQNADSISDQLNSEIISGEVSLKSNPPKPIIIVGSKGAGKTTFINYLFKSKLPSDTISKYPYVYIDLIQYYDGKSEIDTKRISENIVEMISDKYPELEINSIKVLKRIYKKEIDHLTTGVWSLYEKNTKEYNQKLADFLGDKLANKVDFLNHLSRYLVRERRVRLIIVLDNSDQFEDKLQENAFLYASSLNRSAYCGVIISLREGYYYRWRNYPPFNAFESNVYHITAPKYSEVLQKRIDYIATRINPSTTNIQGNISTGARISMSSESILTFLSSVKDSIFNEKNTQIVDFLNFTTFPNTREGLRIFKLFLISGYTDIDEYIIRATSQANRQVKDVIPIHEFVKSIGLNNRLYYNSEYSVISNIFNPNSESNDHFIKFWILRILAKRLDEKGNVNKFIPFDEFINTLNNYGYHFEYIKEELKYLMLNDFIDTDGHITDISWSDIVNFPNICITPKGYYYISKIISNFYYIDLTLQDTPIYDEDHFNSVKTTFPEANEKGRRDLQKRLTTVTCFINYLKAQEKKIPQNLLQEFGSPTDYILSNGLQQDLDKIHRI